MKGVEESVEESRFRLVLAVVAVAPCQCAENPAAAG
jgi:hypothetical protein